MLTLEDILARHDLSGLDLTYCSLGAADLRGKNLRGTDLSHAHLGAADLSGADLRNAKLCRANLGAALLIGADLRYCDLREANLMGTRMDGADMRDVIGLEHSFMGGAPDVKPLTLEVTDDFLSAQREGYYPLSHWGRTYALSEGDTLYRNPSAWQAIKRGLGDIIFGDRGIFSEVRLVQQYKEYSQWAYMLSTRGFELLAARMGLQVRPK